MKWNNSTVSISTFNMTKLLYQKYYQQLSQKLHQSAEDDYTKAIATLNLLQSNAKNLKGPQTPQFLQGKLDKLCSFLLYCDLDVRQLEDQLSVIHVSGTKGKGSTCAYCESILQNYGLKTGFFSSPHLVSVRERIRIDGQPISRKQFAKCFWDVHKKLDMMKNKENTEKEMPAYFMFLTIMALKIFFELQVDVAIIEVGIGGEYDYTNILSNTAVVGISSLGLDHVKILGETIEEIAFQKSGIMKSGCIALTVPDQPAAALRVIRERAIERKSHFFIAPKYSQYSLRNDVKLGIEGLAQESNASLAIQLVHAWMNIQRFKRYEGPTFHLSKEMIQGLASCRWPGRTQLLNYAHNLTYYFDGAHTVESMHNCVSWYQSKAPARCALSKRVLVFNMTGCRDPRPLMKLLLPQIFDYVFFCPNQISSLKNDLFQDNADLHTSLDTEYERIVGYRKEWMQLNAQFDENRVKIFYDVLSVHEFLEQKSNDEKFHVLITGSLHLVGAFLALLDPDLKASYKIN